MGFRSSFLLLLLLSSACGNQNKVSEVDQQTCAGMYERGTFGGSVNPFISLNFTRITGDDQPSVSLAIYEYADVEKIGVWDDRTLRRYYVCDQAAMAAAVCTQEDEGDFIILNQPNATREILTQKIDLSSFDAIRYDVKYTGYYCVATIPLDPVEFDGIVVFQNSFGQLSAAEYPKLPFYGGFAILYALVAVLWGFMYWQHRQDILPVQNYITAIVIFLPIEMVGLWGYYDYTNRHGISAGSRLLLIITTVLGASRNSFSFFLLLIVCMGYGVVKLTLGPLMWKCRALALTHFAFGIAYGVASLVVTPETAGPLVLLIIVPLAATMTAFYLWTLTSLGKTIRELDSKRQNIKALMYKRLWRLILGSVLVIFGFFFLNSILFVGSGVPDFAPANWRTRWFVLDGWLNIVFLADLLVIAFLWRPTTNNRRFAMSQEIQQNEDDDFEITSLGGTDDEEASPGRKSPEQQAPPPPPPFYAPPTEEGEAIFSVGEDDEDDAKDWSEDENERQKLT